MKFEFTEQELQDILTAVHLHSNYLLRRSATRRLAFEYHELSNKILKYLYDLKEFQNEQSK